MKGNNGYVDQNLKKQLTKSSKINKSQLQAESNLK